MSNIQDKSTYIRKLETRIHNQRVSLRSNWEILEQRIKNRPTLLRAMWFDKVKRLVAENKELKNQLNKIKNRKEVFMLSIIVSLIAIAISILAIIMSLPRNG